MIDEKTVKKMIVLSSIIFLVVLSILVVWPIVLSIFVGLLLSYMFYPLYIRTTKLVREKNVSALIIVLLLIFVIFIPIWFLFPVMARQALDAYLYIQKVDIFSFLRTIFPEMVSTDTLAMLNNLSSNFLGSCFSQSSQFLLNLPNLLLQLVIVLFVFFFGMRDADKIKGFVKAISPFSLELEKNLSKQFKDVTNAVVYGHILVGILQGILTGIGLLIFGASNVLLLTVLAVLAAILPVIGAWLVWLPVSVFLIASGHTGAGIGLFLYGALLVSWIDNLIRPYIISRRTALNSGVALIGMIGGLITFGLIGVLLGPIILAYLQVLLNAYKNRELAGFFKQ